MKKRLLAVFLAFALCLGLMSATAFASWEWEKLRVSYITIGSAGTHYPPWEDAERKDEGWSYDAATGTITLTNYSDSFLRSDRIYQPLTIVLNGENTIEYADGSLTTYAIENSVIRGDGTLNCGDLFVHVPNNLEEGRAGGLTMESGTLDCDIDPNGYEWKRYVNWDSSTKMTISGGTLRIHGGEGGLHGAMFGEKNIFSVTGTGTLILEGSKYAIELTNRTEDGAIVSGLESAKAVDRNGNPLHWKHTVETIPTSDGLFSSEYHVARLYNADGSIATYAKITAGPSVAKPTNDKLTVDGKAVVPAAYKINGANYFKLRDVAMMLNGTKGQFSVVYNDATKFVNVSTGQPYAPQGNELKGTPTANGTAILSNNAIYINGEKSSLTVYKIGGENYFKIRELGQALNFNVGWTAERGMFIESDKPYDSSN